MAKSNKVVYGYIEKAVLADKNLRLSAKLDTGAKSASLNARQIEQIEIKGKPYIRFKVPTPNGNVEFTQPFLGMVKIKARKGEVNIARATKKAYQRPVVLMKIELNGKVQDIEVNLANRKNFIYPLLLGREAIIAFDGIVDPSETFLVTSHHNESE